jgi:hypothetical protein
MVVHPVYPVFFIRLFSLSAAMRRFRLNIRAQEPLIREVDRDRVRLVQPGGVSEILETQKVGEKRYIRFDNTVPGDYRVQPDPEDPDRSFLVTVKREYGESDYRSVGGEERAALEDTLAPLMTDEAVLAGAVGRSYPAEDFDFPLTFGALLLLVAGAALSRRWFS